MTDDNIDRPGARLRSRMRGLGLAIALASLSYPAMALADDTATPPAKIEGFTVPQARPVPGFDQTQTESDAAKPAVAATPPVDPAGRYAIFRAAGKDTGCMLNLDESRGKGGSKATLSPACRDQGIVIFDPVGWRIAKGSLVLTARKGPTVRLDRQKDGRWMAQPKDGKTLILKKM
ncbi:MAG TPA: AprI/Inh family metalloprotease inhibitor [Methylovirgula sp.]